MSSWGGRRRRSSCSKGGGRNHHSDTINAHKVMIAITEGKESKWHSEKEPNQHKEKATKVNEAHNNHKANKATKMSSDHPAAMFNGIPAR